jgi:hypothetical protein
MSRSVRGQTRATRIVHAVTVDHKHDGRFAYPANGVRRPANTGPFRSRDGGWAGA